MEALSETENDAIAFIHASDAESWAVFLQKKLCSDDYKIESCFHAPHHDDIPELFSSSKTCAVLVSPTLLEEDHSSFWSRCVDLFHQRTVILFLGVSKEDMRGSLGEDITQKVLDQRCLEVDGSSDAVTRALIALIEAYEANEAHEAEGYDYLPPPRERNGILRAFPAVLYEYGSHDILVLLEREEEDTVTMTTEIGCGSPLPIKVERVTFSAYIATLPNKLLGEVELEVLAGNRSLGFVSVRVESRMEQLHSLLLLETSPLTLMCKAMGVSAAGCSDVEELDSMLAQRLTVSQFPPGLLDVMRSDDQATADRDNRRWPTLLHLAAEFNLARVCEELLGYPGMVHDACTENREGLLPCQLAGKKGFHALQRRLIRYVEDMRLRRSATDSGISFEESSSPQPHRNHRSSGCYENYPGPMPGDRSKSVHDDYIDMSGLGLHGGSLKSWSFPKSFLVEILPEVGSAEAGGSKETDQSRRQHTAELLRQTVSECVSRPNTLSSQHWPDPGRPDTSDDQDHHVPARVGYLATHKQQDPGSSGKTRSWSVSTSRSSATDSSESRPERAESEKWWHLGSRIKGRSASQTSSDSQRSDHEGIAEEEGAEGDAKTAATSQNEASLRTKGPRKSMAKNLISSILNKMNMQRMSHARIESDLHIMANAQRKPVVYSRTNTMSTPNPSGFRDLSSSMKLNESSMYNDGERDSRTLCDGDYNLSRRRMSLRVERALHEDLSQRPPLPPRRK